MVRTVNQTERSVAAEPANAITVVANTATTILPDLNVNTVPNINTDLGFEIAGRYIFNNTGGKLYYAFGTPACDNVKVYHGIMADQQMLDCSNHGQMVSVYSVAGGPVAATILHRRDLFPHRGAHSLPAIRT